jgi:periplasmic protein CpxP/Spy
MKNVKSLIVAGMLAGTFGMTLPAFAQPPGGVGGPGYHGKTNDGKYGGPSERRWVERMIGKLDLSDEQKAQVKEISDESRDKAKPLMEEMRSGMLKERAALDDGASERALKKLARQSAETRVDLMLIARDTEVRIREILTDEQRQKLDQMKATRKAHMEMRRQKWQEKMESTSKE